MKWSEMTPEQRNALVAEKVMGVDPYCHGKLTALRGSTSALICTECSQTFNRYDVGDIEAFQHFTPGSPPHYTTDMNAAWLVVEYITHADLLPIGPQNPLILSSVRPLASAMGI